MRRICVIKCNFGVADLLKTGPRPTFTWVTVPNLIALVKQYTNVLQEKMNPSRPAFQGHSRSSELTHRSAVYDFLLMFHINHGPILYRFRDIARCWPNIANFPTPCFNSPLRGFPLELCKAGWDKKKTGKMRIGLPSRENCLMISLAVSIQHMSVTDG